MSQKKKKGSAPQPPPPPPAKKGGSSGFIAFALILAALGIFAFAKNKPEQQKAQTQTAPANSTQTKPAAPQTKPADTADMHHDHAQEESAASEAMNFELPPYYANPENASPLKPTLDPETVNVNAKEAYVVASKKPKLLAQLPCFCYCNRFGHKSLHDCYTGTHAEECDICMKEALEADKMDQEGLKPDEIRRIIIENFHPRS